MSLNKTVIGAKNVHGSDPQFLIEKIVRERIYGCRYWKERCFGLTAETIVDRIIDLNYIGGTYGGNQKPTDFLCLLLKLLQLQPAEDIVMAFIEAEEHKYLRCLGAMYFRMVGRSERIYPVLEELLKDFRKIRLRQKDGSFTMTRIDEFVESLLKQERLYDLILPRLAKRTALEDSGVLQPRISPLQCEEIEGAERAEGNKAEGTANEGKMSNFQNESEDEEKREKVKSERWKPEKIKVKKRVDMERRGDDGLEEENALRAKLGLKPLEM